jgi:hypothetical protein
MKFLERFFQKIFVGVYKGKRDFNIYVIEVSATGKKSAYYETFDVNDRDALSRFLIALQRKTPVIYIGFLDTAILQGAIPTCSRHEAKNFPCVQECKDFDDLTFHCYGENWNIYTSRSGVLSFQESYETIGYDYLFSPFFLIKPLFQNTFPDETTFYILVENEFTTFSILTGEKLLYGRYVKNIDENLETIENVKSELEDALHSGSKDKEEIERERDKEFNSSIAGKSDSEEFDDSVSDIRDSLDDIDKSLDDKSLDTLDTLDDLNDLQDIGTSLDDSDDNRVDLNKVEGSIDKEGLQGKTEKGEEDLINENLTKEIDNIVEEVEQEGVKVEREEEEIPVLDKSFIYQQIKKSIKEFYDSELYEPDFIGKAYLITNVDFDPQFTEKLTDEMGFHFEQVGVDTPKLIAKLAIDEAGYEI